MERKEVPVAFFLFFASIHSDDLEPADENATRNSPQITQIITDE